MERGSDFSPLPGYYFRNHHWRGLQIEKEWMYTEINLLRCFIVHLLLSREKRHDPVITRQDGKTLDKKSSVRRRFGSTCWQGRVELSEVQFNVSAHDKGIVLFTRDYISLSALQ